MKKTRLLLIASALFLSTALFAQPKNVVKLNLPSLMYTAFDLQYERALTPVVSAQLSVNWRPKGSIPMAGSLGLETDVFAGMTTSWLSITPEMRLYTSGKKDAPKGFYFILPYVRYSKLNLMAEFDVDLPVVDMSTGTTSTQVTPIDLKGSLSLLGAGFGIGNHWMIKDKVSIDVTWLGVEYYFSNKFTASADSKASGWKDLIDIAGPELEKEFAKVEGIDTEIDGTAIKMSAKVPALPFVRFGFAIGYAF